LLLVDESGSHLFVPETPKASAITGMLNGYGACITSGIKIQNSVFIQVPAPNDPLSSEFDVKGVGVLKILYLHAAMLST
jgi:hypothetical protein